MSTILTPWKKQLLSAYYYATLPGRCWRRGAMTRTGRAPVMIVFYHRVADSHPNDWTISNRNFARQIDWLDQQFDFVSLQEAQRRIREGNTRPAVSITFDDGYADNCDHALPLLISRNVPFTYFVTTQFVLSGASFPHDAVAATPLAPNTVEQLRSLVAAGVEIGAHTRSHCDLGQVTEDARLLDEVVAAREDLQAEVDCEIRYFAFPFGLHQNLNRRAFQLAREAGYAGVCSAYGGYNVPGDDAFHLQRFHGDPDFTRLRNWVTLDRRKLTGVERFDYSRDESANA